MIFFYSMITLLRIEKSTKTVRRIPRWVLDNIKDISYTFLELVFSIWNESICVNYNLEKRKVLFKTP